MFSVCFDICATENGCIFERIGVYFWIANHSDSAKFSAFIKAYPKGQGQLILINIWYPSIGIVAYVFPKETLSFIIPQ